MLKVGIGIAIGTVALGLFFYWLKKRRKSQYISIKTEGNGVVEYGVQVFDENGKLQATLTEREMSIVHYTLYYHKGTGNERDVKFLSARVREYPGYKSAGGGSIDGPATWTWDGGSKGFEVNPQQPVILGEEWYAMSSVVESSSKLLIKPWTMPGSMCLYDRGSNKFLCRAENPNISGLLITVGSK